MRCCIDHRLPWIPVAALLAIALLVGAETARAGTPLSLYRTHAGAVDYVGTGGTLRTSSNSGDACAVGGSDSGLLSGIPAGASVEAAYLYWAGSYSNNGWSTQTMPDQDVVFDGQAVQADRIFTETFSYNGNDYDFFSGFEDVTAQVAAKGNGVYTFSGLSVNTDWPHCPVQAVVAGWSLIVVYNQPGGPNQIVNIYDGFEYYRGGEISLTMNNFRIAASGISGQASHLTWEGDSENSNALGGFSESMLFNGTALSDGYNPANNQFNSTINVLGSTSEWGVDFDVYDIGPLLHAGDSSATAVYRSGQDLVLLSAEVIAVSNAPSANLSLRLSTPSTLAVDRDGLIRVDVNNAGPSEESGPVQVTVTLSSDLTVLGASDGWLMDSSSAPTFVFRAPSSLPAGSTQGFDLQVRPTFSAAGSQTVSGTVSGVEFDYDLADNSDSHTFTVDGLPAEVVAVQFTEVQDDPVNGTSNPKAIPGAHLLYTVEVSNQLPSDVDDGSVVLTVPVPVGTSLCVEDIDGAGSGPVLFQDGSPTSGLVFDYRGLRNRRDDLQFSRNGRNWRYRPRIDANGCDKQITHLRITPGGVFPALGPSGAPRFTLKFRVLLR